ncbi:MAG: ATP-grasp domain-containing protein [Ignavibacteria bacterium]|jgi:hypothetical protein|nr:ATP-grasp domain-containing protein [Ignavibacteria bacterium]MCU7502876.1 ATP-grasp domain-containing protein [Ignavibacteria bacterium]MCU7515630.1 ATP-grasp domain-containing protein [Ignavibacteria bacterium]
MNHFSPDCLIIAPEANDPQSVTLFEELSSRGKKPYMLAFKEDGKIKTSNIVLGNDKIVYGEDLSAVKAVYIRCINTGVPPVIPPLLNAAEFSLWQARYLMEESRQKVFSGMIGLLEKRGALVINPPSAYFHHNAKAQFFYMLEQEGLPVPYTFATGSLRFYKKKILHNDEEFIIKAGYGVGGTRRLLKNMVPEKEELQYCPSLFQEEIKGSTIRVHTVGNSVVLALRIVSEDIDSRSDAKGFEAVSLSPEHEALIARANRLLGLNFSAWDVIVAPDNSLYLLDCNPGPYIWWIGPYFSRVVLSRLADLIAFYIERGTVEDFGTSASFNPEIPLVRKQDERVDEIMQPLTASWKNLLRLRN